MEARIKAMDVLLSKPEYATDMKLIEEYAQTMRQLDEENDRWMQLSEELEQLIKG
jgi:ATP-binding cassette subfamily F protein 3